MYLHRLYVKTIYGKDNHFTFGIIFIGGMCNL